ncbi:MAG: glycosyltransferase family 39 protein [Candidatus Sulfotelmatobacter sp.]
MKAPPPSRDLRADLIESAALATVPPLLSRIFSPTIVCAVLIGGTLLLGSVSIAVSFLSFQYLHAKALALSRSQVLFFTPDFYQHMRVRLQLVGAFSLAVTAAVLTFRRRVFRFLEILTADAAIFGSMIASEWKAVLAQDLWAIAVIVCLAALLRIPLLSQPMRYDEAYTVTTYASRPLYIGLSLYTQPNNHLFHTFFVHIAYVLFGNRPWALRLPAFFAGLLLVPATYIAARSLYRTESAILAAALTSTSSVLIEYSTNSRGYSLVCLCFTMLIPIAAYMIRNRGWTPVLLFSIFATLGFYTIPIMLYPVGGVAVWMLLSAAGDAKSSRHIVSDLFVAGLLTAVLTTGLYSPVFAVSGPASVFANSIVRPLPTDVFLRDLPLSFVSTWRYWNRGLPLVLIITLAAGFGISLIYHIRCSRFRIPLALALVIWVVPLLFIQRVVPFERVWTFALPLYFIASASGLELVAKHLLKSFPLRHGMTLVVVVMFLWTAWYVRRGDVIYSTNEGRGMQDTAIYLKPRLTTGDSVLVALPSLAPLEYYFLKQEIPIAYLNAPVSHRRFVVVNHVADDTLAKVFASREIDPPRYPVRPVAQFDTVVLYEIQ